MLSNAFLKHHHTVIVSEYVFAGQMLKLWGEGSSPTSRIVYLQ